MLSSPEVVHEHGFGEIVIKEVPSEAEENKVQTPRDDTEHLPQDETESSPQEKIRKTPLDESLAAFPSSIYISKETGKNYYTEHYFP